jgi:hypothetical protein
LEKRRESTITSSSTSSALSYPIAPSLSHTYLSPSPNHLDFLWYDTLFLCLGDDHALILCGDQQYQPRYIVSVGTLLSINGWMRARSGETKDGKIKDKGYPIFSCLKIPASDEDRMIKWIDKGLF